MWLMIIDTVRKTPKASVNGNDLSFSLIRHTPGVN